MPDDTLGLEATFKQRLREHFNLTEVRRETSVEIPEAFREAIGDRVVKEYYEVRSWLDWLRGRRVGIVVLGRACAVIVQSRKDLRWYPFEYSRIEWMERRLRRDWKQLRLTWMDDTFHIEMEVPRWAIPRIRHVFRLARKHWKPTNVTQTKGPFR